MFIIKNNEGEYWSESACDDDGTGWVVGEATIYKTYQEALLTINRIGGKTYWICAALLHSV